MAGFYDFDAARTERRARGPVLRAFGDEVTLPTSMPVALVLLRARVAAEGTVTVAMAADQLRTMVGDRIDVWMAENPDLDEDDLVDLLGGCVRLIREHEGEDREGEARPPAAGASGSSTSSSSGRSSKRTSSGTTASTSRKRSSKGASGGGGSKR